MKLLSELLWDCHRNYLHNYHDNYHDDDEDEDDDVDVVRGQGLHTVGSNKAKMGPRWAPSGLKIVLRSSWNIGALKGPLLNDRIPFWALLGPYWGPQRAS